MRTVTRMADAARHVAQCCLHSLSPAIHSLRAAGLDRYGCAVRGSQGAVARACLRERLAANRCRDGER